MCIISPESLPLIPKLMTLLLSNSLLLIRTTGINRVRTQRCLGISLLESLRQEIGGGGLVSVGGLSSGIPGLLNVKFLDLHQ